MLPITPQSTVALLKAYSIVGNKVILEKLYKRALDLRSPKTKYFALKQGIKISINLYENSADDPTPLNTVWFGRFLLDEHSGLIPEKEKKPINVRKIINIAFLVIIGVLAIVLIDLVCVLKFHVGPFFAVRTNVYEDGGTKVYYGLGYKVIKYNQDEGKKGTKVGFWTMPYTAIPTPVDILDLAIAYRNDPEATYKKYYDQYLQLTGTVYTVDNQKKVLTIRYIDPDGKYTLDVVANMYDEDVDLSVYSVGSTVSFVGSVNDYRDKTDTTPNQIWMRDCFMRE